jgi:hypothetical protein
VAAAAFFCVSSEPYFIGAVGLVNSLRLVGHREPIFVMDCGLTAAQRKALGGEAEVVAAPAGREPHTLKPALPLARPADVMVLIDADMIVTRSLAPLIADAAAGRVVAFRNHADRFVPEWGPLLGLGEIEQRPYLCSGFLAAARPTGEEVLGLLDDRQGRVDLSRSYFGSHDDDYPLLYADQDVLNAVLAARVAADRVEALDAKLAPMVPFDGLRLEDPETLACAFADGTRPYVVHHSLSPKPWQRPAPEGVYSRLLRRLLRGSDVAVRLPRASIPPTLRSGPRGTIARRLVNRRR